MALDLHSTQERARDVNTGPPAGSELSRTNGPSRMALGRPVTGLTTWIGLQCVPA